MDLEIVEKLKKRYQKRLEAEEPAHEYELIDAAEIIIKLCEALEFEKQKTRW